MSIVRFEKHWNGATGSATQAGREYAAVYKCVTDDPLDNAQTIIDYIQTTEGLTLGISTYAYGNDSDTGSFLKSIDPSRLSESNLYWDVVLGYAPPESTDNRTEPVTDPDAEDGETSDDPEEWFDKFNIDAVPFTIPCEKAIYRGGYKGVADRMLKRGGGVTIPQNSAFMPFVPGLETEIYGQSISRSFYTNTYTNIATFERLLGYVNENLLTAVVAAISYSKSFRPYTLKLNKVGARNEFLNGGVWWYCTIEMMWHPLGWRSQVADRGRYLRQAPGDKDPITGTTLSPSDFEKGDAYVAAITDARGNMIDDDVLFDGDGSPAEPGAQPVYGIWSKYPEAVFPNTLFTAKSI